MNRRAVITLCLSLSSVVGPSVSGCRKREAVVLSEPGLPPQDRPPPAPPAPEPEPGPSAEPAAYDPMPSPDLNDPGALAAPTQPATQPTQAAQPAPAANRDLSAELSAALEGVTDCVDASKVASLPQGRLTISVTAFVLGTGTFSRADVLAPGQPEAAKACLQKQVMGLRLPPDVPNAPVRVTGSTEVRVQAVGTPTPTKSTQAPPSAPTNPDIARPDPPDLARPDPPDLAGPP